MKSKIDWFIHRENLPFHEEEMLHYVSRLRTCVESYNKGEINVDTALKTSEIILNEIDNPEFPFFAVKNFRELFSIIFYQLPEISAVRLSLTPQSKGQCELNWKTITIYKGQERRKHKRIEKPYMARQKDALFNYNINLGIVDQLKEEDLCRILLKMCRGNSSNEEDKKVIKNTTF